MMASMVQLVKILAKASQETELNFHFNLIRLASTPQQQQQLLLNKNRKKKEEKKKEKLKNSINLNVSSAKYDWSSMEI